MASTNRKYASQRMKNNNPMKREEVRAKVSSTLRAMGWGPVKRGGNGRGATIHQQALASSLGWECEVVVTTGEGYIPNHYKIDIAEEVLKIAIEVDGHSHKAKKVRAADKRKEEFLLSQGWKVLRFSNQEIEENLSGCVRKVLSMI